MNSRLYKVRKVLKMSQVEFGREIGVSGAAISRIEKGERGLTEQMLKSVCREYHVRREWLTEGTGEMFRWDKSDLLERIDALLKTQGDPRKGCSARLWRCATTSGAALPPFHPPPRRLRSRSRGFPSRGR